MCFVSFIFALCVCVFCINMYRTSRVPDAKRGPKRVSDHLELELQMTVSYHVSTGDLFQVRAARAPNH